MPSKRAKSEEKGGACCGPECCQGGGCCGGGVESCCEVEAVVAVDPRGQMVLPRELREKLGIAAGQKLALMTWKKGEKLCCLTLIPVSELEKALRQTYGPVLKEIVSP